MKRIVFCLLLIGIALSAGCTTSSAPVTATTPSAPAVSGMPDLVGNWTGSFEGYMDTTGYQAFHDSITLTITEQKGRLFRGHVTFMANGTLVTKDIAGALSRDEKTFETIESPDGFSDGVIISADEMEMIFRDTTAPTSIAIDTFKRST
jgi:hypothetical protein